MKGLICYACFCGVRSYEKLHSYILAKSSFLMPDVTTLGLSRPTIFTAVSGFTPSGASLTWLFRPGTVFFSALSLYFGGWARYEGLARLARARANRFKEIP